MEHSKFLSPSSIPAILQCNAYESDGGNSSTNLGTVMHDCCEEITLNGEHSEETGEQLSYSQRKSCEVAVTVAKEKAKEYLGEDFAIDTETRISINDDQGNEITFGTADFVAWSDKAVFLLDYKSGFDFDIDSKDYYGQMCAYALGLMQKYKVDSVKTVIWYIIPEQGKEYDISYNQAVSVVTSAYKRKLADKQPLVCDYCSWCKHVLNCEAVNKGLAKINSLYGELTIEDDISRPETIKDPVKINEYLLFNDLILKPYTKKLESVSNRLRDAGLNSLSTGSLKNYEIGKRVTNKLDVQSVEGCNPLVYECIADHIEVSLNKVIDAYYERKNNNGEKITKKAAKEFVTENLRYYIHHSESLTLKKKKQ
jgi:CRISPR/Cas system-associated exonuclease Cas4 (RecB family)